MVMPILMLGLGNLLKIVTERTGNKALKNIIVISLSSYLVVLSVYVSVLLGNGELAKSASELPFITDSATTEMVEVGEYLDRNVNKGDYLIAPHNISWRTKAKISTPVFVACYLHRDEYSFLAEKRFAWAMDVENAKYVAFDKLFVGDASPCIKHRADVFKAVRDWPVSFENSRFIVYGNPALVDDFE
jgi:hypothetical protein